MAKTLDISEEVCTSTMRKFNQEAPFLKILFDNVMNQANKKGYIKTILGRKARFDFWTHSFDETPVKTYGHAKSKWENKQLFRAFTSKALNRLIKARLLTKLKLQWSMLLMQAWTYAYQCTMKLTAWLKIKKRVYV